MTQFHFDTGVCVSAELRALAAFLFNRDPGKWPSTVRSRGNKRGKPSYFPWTGSRVTGNHAHADDWHPGGGFLAHMTAIRL